MGMVFTNKSLQTQARKELGNVGLKEEKNYILICFIVSYIHVYLKICMIVHSY